MRERAHRAWVARRIEVVAVAADQSAVTLADGSTQLRRAGFDLALGEQHRFDVARILLGCRLRCHAISVPCRNSADQGDRSDRLTVHAKPAVGPRGHQSLTAQRRSHRDTSLSVPFHHEIVDPANLVVSEISCPRRQ